MNITCDDHRDAQLSTQGGNERIPSFCPQRSGIWRDLLANVAAGARIKRPEQKRIIEEADHYMRLQFDLWLAATAWYDAVTSDLDDTVERERLLATIRRSL